LGNKARFKGARRRQRDEDAEKFDRLPTEIKKRFIEVTDRFNELAEPLSEGQKGTLLAFMLEDGPLVCGDIEYYLSAEFEALRKPMKDVLAEMHKVEARW
jgi:hypothetical protein